MKYIKTIDGIKPLNISITNEYRFLCYRPYLESALESLQKEFQHNEVINHVIFHDSSLIVGLSTHLSEILMYYVQIDNDRFADSNDYPENVLSQEDFVHYIFESYANYSEEDGIGLGEILSRLTKNFLRAVGVALTRICGDHDNIIKCFFPEFGARPDDVFLAKVIPTGSDLHRKGQQVLILEYHKIINGIKTDEIVGKVVYKPTSLWVDAVIIGDTQRLRERHVFEPLLNAAVESGKSHISEIENNQAADSSEYLSLAEKLNVYMDRDNIADARIPTYLIYPREEEGLNGGYGYLEYFSHQPWCNENQLIDELIDLHYAGANGAEIERYVSHKIVHEILPTAVNHIQEGKPVDYVLQNKDEYLRYSDECGLLLGLSRVAHAVDRHFDNCKISNKKIKIFDWESSGDIFVTNFLDTFFFDEHGIFNGKMKNYRQEFFDRYGEALGMEYFPVPAQNQMYRFNQDHKIQPCLFDKARCLLSVQYLLKVIRQHAEELITWLHQPYIANIWARFIPYETSLFESQRRMMIHSAFRRETFDLIVREQLKNDLDLIQHDDASLNRLRYSRSAPSFAIFLSDQIYHSYCDYDVPSFYMRLNDRRLVDSNGNAVIVDYVKAAKILGCVVDEERRIAIKDDVEYHLPENTDQFFDETPISVIERFIRNIATDDEYLSAVVQNLAQHVLSLPDDGFQGNGGEMLQQDRQGEQEHPQETSMLTSEEVYRD